MAHYFSPNEIQPKSPITCCCIPVKYFLAIVHFLCLLNATIYVYPFYDAFPHFMLLPLYYLIVLVAFYYGSILIMIIHFVLSIIMFAIEILVFVGVGGFFLSLAIFTRDFSMNEFAREHINYEFINALHIGSSMLVVLICIIFILTLCWMAFYLNNCLIHIQHVQAKKQRQVMILPQQQEMCRPPAYDTVQGQAKVYKKQEYSPIYPNV